MPSPNPTPRPPPNRPIRTRRARAGIRLRPHIISNWPIEPAAGSRHCALARRGVRRTRRAEPANTRLFEVTKIEVTKILLLFSAVPIPLLNRLFHLGGKKRAEDGQGNRHGAGREGLPPFAQLATHLRNQSKSCPIKTS